MPNRKSVVTVRPRRVDDLSIPSCSLGKKVTLDRPSIILTLCGEMEWRLIVFVAGRLISSLLCSGAGFVDVYGLLWGCSIQEQPEFLCTLFCYVPLYFFRVVQTQTQIIYCIPYVVLLLCVYVKCLTLHRFVLKRVRQCCLIDSIWLKLKNYSLAIIFIESKQFKTGRVVRGNCRQVSKVLRI